MAKRMKVKRHILFHNGTKGRGRKVGYICLLECGHACPTVHGKSDKSKVCRICELEEKAAAKRSAPAGYTLINKRELARLRRLAAAKVAKEVMAK